MKFPVVESYVIWFYKRNSIFEFVSSNLPGYDRDFWLAASDEDYEGVWLWSDGTPVRMGPPFWAYVSFISVYLNLSNDILSQYVYEFLTD